MSTKVYNPNVDFTVKSLAIGRGGPKLDPAFVAALCGFGNVYVVVNSGDTTSYGHLYNKLNGAKYSDGSSVMYVGNTLTANVALQAALDACVACRNDYIMVMPSDYNYGLAAALTMSKKAVHLICPAGLSGNAFPVGNTARIKQLGAYTGVTITAQAIEIAGFFLKNYTAKSWITLKGVAAAGAASSPNIHHNMFAMVWSGTPDPIIMPYSGTDDGGSWGSIEHNQFISESGTSITSGIAAVSINAQATGARVCHNEVTIGDGNTATICISNLAVKGHTDFNIFSESGGAAATPGGGTITNAILISTMGCAIGNRGAVGNNCLLSGGTTAHSFSDNVGGHTGDCGHATQLES